MVFSTVVYVVLNGSGASLLQIASVTSLVDAFVKNLTALIGCPRNKS